jgi:hypothetical protein
LHYYKDNLRESQIDNVDVCRWDISDISMEIGSAQDRRIIEGRFEGLGRVFFLDLKTEGYNVNSPTIPVGLHISYFNPHSCYFELSTTPCVRFFGAKV